MDPGWSHTGKGMSSSHSVLFTLNLEEKVAGESTAKCHARTDSHGDFIVQVEEYMEQLDNNRPPKIGSKGEKNRDLQLIIQLPKQVNCLSFATPCFRTTKCGRRKLHRTTLMPRRKTFCFQDLSEDYLKNLKSAGQRRAFEEFKHLRDVEIMDIGEVRDYIPQDMVRNGVLFSNWPV